MNFKDFIAQADYHELCTYNRLLEEKINEIESEPKVKLWYFGDISFIVAYFTSYTECCTSFADYLIKDKESRYEEGKKMDYKMVYKSEVESYLETNVKEYRKK